jgi:membrane protein implicated in regulation of membrane protease activity
MNMIIGNSSIVGIIINGLWIAFVITVPILIIIVVARVIRRMVTPHDKEMQRLLGQVVTLLEENNRLLAQQIAGKQLDEKREKTPPAGEAG